jgi:ABC-2 type transport system ATP-binding protein
MSRHALEIRGLRKSFPRFTLGPIDITVPTGVIYGFVGPNGAGKTTTIDLIFGMGAKTAGSITVFGVDHLRDEVAVKRQVGYVSPDLDFRPWRRVHQAIRFVRGFYPTWDQAYCDHLLHVFHLTADQVVHEFSFGARIKLALTLALSWRPKLLVLDEPTVGLDAISRQQVFAELLAAVRDEERTVFISSHGITDLERCADRVGMIKDGRMLFEGATAEVVERYRMVDFITDGNVELADAPGLFVQKRENDRWRVLLDRHSAAIEWAQRHGARRVADAPVSLEELFVALGKD